MPGFPGIPRSTFALCGWICLAFGACQASEAPNCPPHHCPKDQVCVSTSVGRQCLDRCSFGDGGPGVCPRGGEVCGPVSAADTHGVCRPPPLPCSGPEDRSCPASLTCAPWRHRDRWSWRCLMPGDRRRGETCGSDDSCRSGLACVPVGETLRCLAYCQMQEDCPSPEQCVLLFEPLGVRLCAF